jgi:hypothetical protein
LNYARTDRARAAQTVRSNQKGATNSGPAPATVSGQLQLPF